jgi:phosphoribosylanthranilate isomerase
MFRIKICGVTTVQDAVHAVECGADAIGLNFYRASARFVSEEEARPIVEAVGGRAAVVGVFVNDVPDAVIGLCGRLGIHRVQLHGDEPEGDAARIGLWRMKAVSASGPVAVEPLRGYPCEAFLLDAGGAGQYGGTGKRLPWEGIVGRFGGVLASPGSAENGKPWILAGGLTPENVQKAIAVARPFGVDVASGVERSPGRKDPSKVAAFVERAMTGFLHAAD